MAVRIERDGYVWTVIHSRPEHRNGMDPDSAEALVDAFLEFENDPDARVAVFWGEGGAFCAGWDLKYAASLQDKAKLQKELVEDLAFPLGANPAPRGPLGPSRLELTKPVIGAIEGPAVAGGMELAMWCDVRVMAEMAYLGVYCRRWGITLMDGGSVRLPRLVGQGKALEIAMTGRKVPAEECYRIGLCEKVVPTGEARAAAEAMAHEIARFPQEAVRADRASIIETRGMPVRDAACRVAEEVGGLGIQLDVSKEHDIVDLVDRTERDIGPIDLFCSNAGIIGASTLATPIDEWQRRWEVNVMSQVYAARAVVPRMIERGGGYLLNTSSAAGLLNQIGSASYGVTKHASIGFGEWVALTHAHQGIKVSMLCPQAVDTAMVSDGSAVARAAAVDGMLEPDDVATAVVEGLREERFLILPHPQVLDYLTRRVGDYDRWIGGMNRLQQKLSSH